MTWVRLDEQFPDHPKVAAAGPLASWLHVCALAYCNRFLTDGFVPSAQLSKLADFTGIYVDVTKFGVDSPSPHLLAGHLVEVGMWTEVPGGYRIHDFHEYQPSKAEVIAQRKSKSEAGKKGAASRWRDGRNGTPDGTSHGRSHGTTYGKTMAEPMAKRCPVPVSVPVGNISSSCVETEAVKIPVENQDGAEAPSDEDEVALVEEATYDLIAKRRFSAAQARGHQIIKPAAWMAKTAEGVLCEHRSEFFRLWEAHPGMTAVEMADVLEGGPLPMRYRMTPPPEVGPGPTEAGLAAMRATHIEGAR